MALTSVRWTGPRPRSERGPHAAGSPAGRSTAAGKLLQPGARAGVGARASWGRRSTTACVAVAELPADRAGRPHRSSQNPVEDGRVRLETGQPLILLIGNYS
jgi:hypothetical protein